MRYNLILNILGMMAKYIGVLFLIPIICAISKEIASFRQKTLRPKLTQAEGFILGVGAKMFTIAGPVIVYGVSASVVYGLIYWITNIL